MMFLTDDEGDMEKPIVHYKGKATVFRDRAHLTPVNHPNHVLGQFVTNTGPVLTSRVHSHDKKSGRIETLNTVYMPLEQS